jgi:hypothetical protein
VATDDNIVGMLVVVVLGVGAIAVAVRDEEEGENCSLFNAALKF